LISVKSLCAGSIRNQEDRVFTLPGIGKLVLVKRKARMGRNPATDEAIKIPAKTVVKMRIAKAAREAIVPGRRK
jgi:DNA-binding protein HU-beta